MTEQFFKAYDNDKKEWIEDFYINEDGDIFTIDFNDFGPTMEYVRNATLVRATSGRYKDSEPVFQFDIVRYISICDKEFGNDHSVGVVVYEDDQFYIKDKGGYRTVFDSEFFFEKLGNLFDSPELLEVEK